MLKNIVIFLFAVVIIASIPVYGDKVVIDPNTINSANQTEVARRNDDRLEQKISYDGVHKRLHDVIDDLYNMSGVVTYSGKNKSDWKVRDYPLLVCSRDLPLGTLLQSIADTTHLFLSSSSTENGITYRVWRDLKREKHLSAFEEAKKAALVDVMSYDWDALSLLKDVPELSFEGRLSKDFSNPDAGRLWGEQTRYVSKTIAALSPEIKDRVLSGEMVVITYKYAPAAVKPYLESLFRSCWKSNELYASLNGQEAPVPLDEDKLNRCRINISPQGFYLADNKDLEVEILGSNYLSMREISKYDFLSTVQAYGPDLPPRPKVPEDVKDDPLDKRYVKLSFSDESGLEFLNTKVKTAKLKDGEEPDYSDLLCAASTATGYSIIAEGIAARYRSWIMSKNSDLEVMFGKEVALRDILAFSADIYKMDWYVDETNKLILGRDKTWMTRLNALVPEKLLQDLSVKIKGDGIELDDLEPMARLNRDQIYEWFYYCPEFPEINELGHIASNVGGKRLCQLYFALSPQEKDAVKHGRSVSLDGFDRSWICSVLRGEITAYMKETAFSDISENANLAEIIKSDSLSDSDKLPDLSIRIQKQEIPKSQNGKHFYTLQLDEKSDNSTLLTQDLYAPFPIRSEQQKSGQKKQTVKP